MHRQKLYCSLKAKNMWNILEAEKSSKGRRSKRRRAYTRKMFTSTITQLSGVRTGVVASGGTSAATLLLRYVLKYCNISAEIRRNTF